MDCRTVPKSLFGKSQPPTLVGANRADLRGKNAPTNVGGYGKRSFQTRAKRMWVQPFRFQGGHTRGGLAHVLLEDPAHSKPGQRVSPPIAEYAARFLWSDGLGFQVNCA